MQAQIDQYTAEINAFSPANADELEAFRIKFLGTKGIIKDLFEQFKSETGGAAGCQPAVGENFELFGRRADGNEY